MAYLAPTSDFVTTTLNGAIVAADDTATIGTGLDLPATNGILQIDYDSATAVGLDEGPETVSYATYTSGTGALAGMVRGLNGTTGVDHNDTSPVQCGPSASYWGSASILTADLADNIITNAKLSTTAGEPGGAWKAWVPTFANFTKDTSTVTAKYTQIGKTVHYYLHVVLAGASVAMGTNPTFTLPVTAVSYPGTASTNKIGYGQIFDANAGYIQCQAVFATTATALIQYVSADQAAAFSGGITLNAPMTWVATDAFYLTGTYEAA